MKIIKMLLDLVCDTSKWFTLIYIWIASCHYLLFNVNQISGNACFYGGLLFFISKLFYAILKLLEARG